MPRNISFSLTKEQFKNRTKTVTRRFGWWFLNPGEILCGVEKAMGLKKGEKIVRLGMIQVVTIRPEPLDAITQEDCIKEGFPHMTPDEFVNKLSCHYRCQHDKIVNRIEFVYL